jgi:hypothetical protein
MVRRETRDVTRLHCSRPALVFYVLLCVVVARESGGNEVNTCKGIQHMARSVWNGAEKVPWHSSAATRHS